MPTTLLALPIHTLPFYPIFKVAEFVSAETIDLCLPFQPGPKLNPGLSDLVK